MELLVDDGADLERAAALAASADVAVVVVGYTRLDEGEYIGEFATGHLTDLFPGEDDPELVERFTAEIASERTIQPPAHVEVTEGGVGFADRGRPTVAPPPRRTTWPSSGRCRRPTRGRWWPWWREAPWSSRSGTSWCRPWSSRGTRAWKGGHGLADVLTGRVEAAGRLPFSVPSTESDLPAFEVDATAFTYDSWHGYWHLARTGTAPAYPFGFGLSYTSFSLEAADVKAVDNTVQVRATVRNTGARPGTDVLQVYGRRLDSSRPERLIGFRRLEIGAGQAAPVHLDLPTTALAERDTDRHAMVVRPGVYEVRVARHAADPGVATRVELA